MATYGNGYFSYGPAGIAVDEEGYSFVTVYSSGGNAHLCVFNSQYQCIHSTTCTNGSFINPAGVAIDKEGFVWVANSSNNRMNEL